MSAAAYSLAGVIVGGGIGVAGQYALANRGERTQRRLARDARLDERRDAICDRLILAARRQLDVVSHVYPIVEVSGAPAGPDDITIDEAVEVQAQIDAWTSPQVATAHVAFSKALRKFEAVVRTQQQLHYQRAGVQGIGVGEPYVLIEDARKEVRERYEELVAAVRSDTAADA